VTKIEKMAFGGCAALEKIVIPQKCTVVGEGAFSGCESLKVVILFEPPPNFKEGVFEDCSEIAPAKILAGDQNDLIEYLREQSRIERGEEVGIVATIEKDFKKDLNNGKIKKRFSSAKCEPGTVSIVVKDQNVDHIGQEELPWKVSTERYNKDVQDASNDRAWLCATFE